MFEQIYNEILDPTKVLNNIAREYQKKEDRRFELYAEKTGLSKADVQELIRVGRKANAVIFEFPSSEGGTDKTGRTLMQCVAMLAHATNPELEVRYIDGNGFAENWVETTTDKLNTVHKGYVQMVDALRQFYKEYYPEIAQEYKNDRGVTLPRDPYYVGTIPTAGSPKSASLQWEAQLNDRVVKGRISQTTASRPGFLKRRINSNREILPQDAEEAARTYNRLAQQYIGMRDFAQNTVSPILRSSAFRNIARNKGMGNVVRLVNDGWKYILTGTAQTDIARSAFIDWLLSGIRFNDLANNPLYIAKHVSSALVNPYQFVPIKDYFKGVLKFNLNPVGNTLRVIKTSPLLLKRFENANSVSATESGKILPTNNNELTQNVIAHMPKHLMEAINNYKTFGMGEITIGSAYQLALVTSVVKDYLMSQGMPEEEALLRGITAAESVGTAARPDLTSFASRTTLGSLLSFLQQQPIHFAQMQIIALDVLLRNPTAKNAAEFMRIMIATNLGLSIFPLTNAIWELETAKDEAAKDEAKYHMMQEVYKVPFIGRGLPGYDLTLNAAMTHYHNKTSETNYSVHFLNQPLLEAVNDSLTFGLKMYDTTLPDADSDEAWGKVGAAFLTLPAAGGMKHPIKAYNRVMNQENE